MGPKSMMILFLILRETLIERSRIGNVAFYIYI